MFNADSMNKLTKEQRKTQAQDIIQKAALTGTFHCALYNYDNDLIVHLRNLDFRVQEHQLEGTHHLHVSWGYV